MKQKHHHTKQNNSNVAGKMITLIQLAISVGFVVLIWNSGMVPEKFIVIGFAVLLLLFVITFALQFVKNNIKMIGMILSALFSIVLLVGILYFTGADEMLEDVGGATYKTDNMIVVVKKNDSAENILDAKNYRFGYQTSVDQHNNELMLQDVETVVGRELKLVEWDTIQEEAQALLDGKVEAAIYNEAFTGIIEDSIEGYSDEVRILYQYGIDTEIEQEETNIKESFNIYISGIDVAGPITTNSRSDVNIIMTVNPKTNQILLTTTPRDYYVQIPGVSGEQRDKLTHAGIYGVDRSMATLEQLYDIDITYYARVNFTSLIEIVDALGGVDVESKYAFTTTHGKYQIKEGMNHMDGEMALGFSRERYSFADGDRQRGKNQEAVLTAILKKAMSPAILKNANKILATVGDSVETNMTKDEMAEFINKQLSDGASWDIASQASNGKGDSQACYSSGSQKLYVMWPDEISVDTSSERIKQV
ncbi:MAG: LCP family protein, partial [Lachnospiraceae bacterium]